MPKWSARLLVHNLSYRRFKFDLNLVIPQAAPLFDKLVFGKVKQRLGGRVKLILTGGAPLARHVEDFLKVTMCCPVVQGYGLTETCAASFIGIPDQIVRILNHSLTFLNRS